MALSNNRPQFVNDLLLELGVKVNRANTARIAINPLNPDAVTNIQEANKVVEENLNDFVQVDEAKDFILYIYDDTSLIGSAEVLNGKLLVTDKNILSYPDITVYWTEVMLCLTSEEVEELRQLPVEEIPTLTLKEFFKECPKIFGPGQIPGYANIPGKPQTEGFHLTDKSNGFKAVRFTTGVNLLEFEGRQSLTFEGLVEKTGWQLK